MGRTRLIRPEHFTDADLYDAEERSGLPLRLAFAGLWTVADREGRFAWKPRELKLDVLPYDAIDFTAALDALASGGFVLKYLGPDGKPYGLVIGWGRHQTPHKTERPSILPPPPSAADNGDLTLGQRRSNGARTVPAPLDTDTDPDTNTEQQLPADEPADEPAAARAERARIAAGERRAALELSVDAVVAHYRAVHPKSRPDTKGNRTKIRTRLNEGYTVADLCEAIDGNARDPWHTERRKHEIEYVLRNGGNVDRFRLLAAAPAGVNGNGGNGSKTGNGADPMIRAADALLQRLQAEGLTSNASGTDYRMKAATLGKLLRIPETEWMTAFRAMTPWDLGLIAFPPDRAKEMQGRLRNLDEPLRVRLVAALSGADA